MKISNTYLLKSLFKQTWLVHISLIVSILCLILFAYSQTQLLIVQIAQSVTASYIAAYIFYILVNFFPSYFQQKNALLTIETELNHIVIDIFYILSILQAFSNENYQNFSLPNKTVYLKSLDSKTFFNPRTELESYIQGLNHELASIKTKYCLLPVDIIVTLNNIERTDLQQKLNSLYDCIDKQYSSEICEFPACLYMLESASKTIQAYFQTPRKMEKYTLMNEEEITQYALERQNAISSINLHGHNGRIYKGSVRIK